MHIQHSQKTGRMATSTDTPSSKFKGTKEKAPLRSGEPLLPPYLTTRCQADGNISDAQTGSRTSGRADHSRFYLTIAASKLEFGREWWKA